jgi:hypothetical protein
MTAAVRTERATAAMPDPTSKERDTLSSLMSDPP